MSRDNQCLEPGGEIMMPLTKGRNVSISALTKNPESNSGLQELLHVDELVCFDFVWTWFEF